jgi:hypothetical protein
MELQYLEYLNIDNQSAKVTFEIGCCWEKPGWIDLYTCNNSITDLEWYSLCHNWKIIANGECLFWLIVSKQVL